MSYEICEDYSGQEVECHYDYTPGEEAVNLSESIFIHTIYRDDTSGNVVDEYNDDDIEDFEQQIWDIIDNRK